MSDILDRYIEELAEDFKVDEMNLKDVQLGLPGKKHFWAAKLIKHTRDLHNLQRLRKETAESVAKSIIEKSPYVVSWPDALRKAGDHPRVEEIDAKIKDIELVVELLKRATDTFKSMTWDIKNITSIIQLETM